MLLFNPQRSRIDGSQVLVFKSIRPVVEPFEGSTARIPVVKHTDTVDFFINFRQLILYPEKPRKGVQRVGLAGFQIEFFFQARIGMDQFGYFVIGSGIYIGTGPDFIAVFVIENDPLAHTGSGNSADFGWIDSGF